MTVGGMKYPSPALFLARFDIGLNGLARSLADYRPHVIGRIVGGAHLDAPRLGRQFREKGVVHLGIDNGPRTGRAFLALIAERRRQNAIHRLVQVRIAIHDDGVLAPHLGDDTLDPDLPGRRLCRQFVDVQAHVARTSERYKPRFRVRHQGVAYRRAASRQQRERALREARLQ